MEFEPRHAPVLEPDPKLDAYQKRAVNALREAIAAVEHYRQAQKHYEQKFQREPLADAQADEVLQVVEDELLPYFLGAPGEICNACGGSGRRK